MDQRFYFGWAASVLGADADHAGEDDDGNKAAQEKPGGEKGGYLDFLVFCLTLPLAGTEVCRDPGKQIRISSIGISSHCVRPCVCSGLKRVLNHI